MLFCTMVVKVLKTDSHYVYITQHKVHVRATQYHSYFIVFFRNATQISHNTMQGLETRLTFSATRKEMANQKFGLKYRGYKPTGESTKSFCAHVCVGVALCIYLDGWRVARRTTVCVIKRFLLVFIKKSHFSRVTETERLEHGTIRSMVRNILFKCPFNAAQF